jgi:thymidylate synthase
MTLTQRSSDYIMANYINKIQYVALQMMVANHCGYKLGKFAHLVQNLHIYDRHMVAVNELLDKHPLTEQPYIELNSDNSFYDITIDDFTIKNIENIKKLSINLEIAI